MKVKVVELCGPGRDILANQLYQVLVELVPAGSEERRLMKSTSNHLDGKQTGPQRLL